jgi:HEAT repeat protein
MVQDKNVKYQIAGALCLGEYGRLQDMSKTVSLTDRIESLIRSDQDDVRQAASIALGKLALGNTGFFLPKIMASIQKPDNKFRYLYLNTIKEVILNNSAALVKVVVGLTEELLKLADHKEDRTRGLVAECLGRLFAEYAVDMSGDMQQALTSANKPVAMATVARSFLYCGDKLEDEMIADTYKECVEMLIDIIGHKDAEVNRYSLEGLRAIVKSNSALLEDHVS